MDKNGQTHTSEEFINDQSSKFLCQELQQVAFMDSSCACVVEIVIALTTQPPWVIRLENDQSDVCLNVYPTHFYKTEDSHVIHFHRL